MSRMRDEWNLKAQARLRRALPAIFPGGVVAHALARPFVPPTPRRAVESYWRHHPLRADRLARALAARSGAPEGWTWDIGAEDRAGRGATFRAPPAPYRDPVFARGPGHCCVCGQPVFRLGWHRDLWGDGRPNRKAEWHAACVAAWKLWSQPSEHVKALRRQQLRRCALRGGRLLRTSEVDHRIPLFQVWREREAHSWPGILAFWGGPNLQVINRAAHAEKCAREAASRAKPRPGVPAAEHLRPGTA